MYSDDTSEVYSFRWLLVRQVSRGATLTKPCCFDIHENSQISCFT